MSQVVGLFPIPLLRAERLLPADLIGALIGDVDSERALRNARSDRLSHTRIVAPDSSPPLAEASRLIAPKLIEFGRLLFGEALEWRVKEMWINVLAPGGQQAMHNHANSFASGIVYLTPSHPSAHTVFMKAPQGRDFVFRNAHAATAQNPFHADRWIAPDPAPGDLLLFPSYLLHEVPVNEGESRISLAFNALPERLDSWGYAVRFLERGGRN